MKAVVLGGGGLTGQSSVRDLATGGVFDSVVAADLDANLAKASAKAAGPRAIVKLPDGTTFEGPVEHNDEFDIAIRGTDGWYRSWPKDHVRVEIRDPRAAHRALMPRYTDAGIHNLFAYLEAQK